MLMGRGGSVFDLELNAGNESVPVLSFAGVGGCGLQSWTRVGLCVKPKT